MPLIVEPGDPPVDAEMEAFYRRVCLLMRVTVRRTHSCIQIMNDPFLMAKLEDELARDGGLMQLQRPDHNGLQPQLPAGSAARQLTDASQSFPAAAAVSKRAGKRK